MDKYISIDYSKKENWYQIPEIAKDVDTFYVYATEYIMGSMTEDTPDYATMDNVEMLEGAAGEYALHASAYAESTNVFMPYYRQVSLRYAGVVWKRDGIFDAAIAGMPYGDIVAALDYYFEHYNNGRPFIIAGHSQGSAIVKMVLKKYFVEHPDYYKRMVAAYPIGYAFTKDEFKAYPHMKFATGECDTGVIITWNTEGPKNREVNADTCVLQPGSMSINPLNWKLDDTYAPASENLGSLWPNEKTGELEIQDIGADAQVFLDRGVVVTHAKGEKMDEEAAKVAAEFFGPDGRHGEDYAFFYNNIKANVAKRIAAYKSNQTDKMNFKIMKAETIILGNVITMDEFKPYAEAIAVADGKIIYVGSKEAAMKLQGENTKVLDYGSNSIYPGFLEAHCHPGFAGNIMFGRANLAEGKTPEDYLAILKKYVQENQDKPHIVGSGWSDDLLYQLNAKQLDEICPDKPMINQSSSGHMMWVNTKAMEAFDINEDAVKQWGTECIHVDENGKPNGLLAEKPAIDLVKRVQPDLAQAKKELLGFQQYAFSNGYTGVYDAGYQLLTKHDPRAYKELDDEGKLKMYSFCGSFVNDNTDTPEEDMNRIAEEAKEYNGKHVKVIGAKVFADGVVEGHTAWMLDDYVDKPGYKGVRRFDDHDKMVRLVKAAAAHQLNVHVHSIGDGATRAWIDAFAQAQTETGSFDMRNALAHLQEVTPEDVKRIGEYNVMAVCGIMWAIKHPAGFAQEVAYVGEQKSYNAYPVKSIMDAGGVVANHSDYPVSPLFSAIQAFCMGVLKKLPSYPDEYIRNIDQAIGRYEALKTLTSNVAYMWHEEDRMGSISLGKLANFAVLDRDFMHDDFAEIEKASCIATIVDGEEVYKNNQ